MQTGRKNATFSSGDVLCLDGFSCDVLIHTESLVAQAFNKSSKSNQSAF